MSTAYGIQRGRSIITSHGQLDRYPNPTANPNPNSYLVAVRYGSLALKVMSQLW